MINRRFFDVFASLLIALGMLAGLLPDGFSPAGATVTSDNPQAPTATFRTINGPPGSGEFGNPITSLPNGNFVVSDPYFDDGTVQDVGAIYLYDGASLALISTLKGSTAGDRVGLLYPTVLSDGNYLVSSPYWDIPGGAADVGAATWCSAVVGCSGTVSAANSLVGGSAGDRLSASLALRDGAYLVFSPYWDAPGPVVDAGIVAWCPAGGCNGTQAAQNGLVIGAGSDNILSIKLLSDGDYIVISPDWDAPGPVKDAGAVTWCPAATGCQGIVSAANSLVGSSPGDHVGDWTMVLKHGYVVATSAWDAPGPVQDVGAVTWCLNSECRGAVSAANSLVGSTAGDGVGWLERDPLYDGPIGVEELASGNYLVKSPYWDAPGLEDAGAVTWCPGSILGGCTGTISAANSLVGSSTSDRVGSDAHMGLSNGNYVVGSPYWTAPGHLEAAGAATWCPGSPGPFGLGGCRGTITAANSLVGSTAYQWVGETVVELSNGNYVVGNPYWDAPGTQDAGAATWCWGTAGCKGSLPATHSLVGSSPGDQVGQVYALSNGDYVAISPNWDAPGPVADAGAVTWCSGSPALDGTTGCKGAVSTANSLVGSSPGDQVGKLSGPLPYYSSVTELSNGSFVVQSPDWDAPGPLADAGAVTWCRGGPAAGGCQGAVSTANSLVGSTAGDQVGIRKVYPLSNGNYVVNSPKWTAPTPGEGGAVTWCDGSPAVGGCRGPVVVDGPGANSLVESQDEYGAQVFPLTSGNYVISQPSWDAPGAANAGAVTWCPGSASAPGGGCRGRATAANSLVGSTAGDQVQGIGELPNGNYTVFSRYWDAPGPLVDAGAVALAASNAPVPVGAIAADNSVTGSMANGRIAIAFDAVNDQLLVGLIEENRVVILKQPHTSIQSGAWGASPIWDFGAPVARSDVVVAGGNTVHLAAPARAQNLTLERGRVVLGAYDLAVGGSLTVNGTPGVERMIAADGGGSLRRQIPGPGSYLFPVGDQTGEPEYSPFRVDLATGSFAPGADLAVRVANARHPWNISANYIQRSWNVTQQGISGYTYNATLGYTPADVAGSEASLRCMKFNPASWLDPWLTGAPADPYAHTCTFTRLDRLSDFTAGDGAFVLTIRLRFFPLIGR